jgi:predicted phage terminase large subunit-like protein
MVAKNNLKELREKLLAQAVKAARTDFLVFVKLMAPTIIADFQLGKHIEVLAGKLQEVDNGTCKRLMVFLPPRSTKSVICSKLFPAWYIGRHAFHEMLSISHSDELASDFGRAVRDIVKHDLYKAIFPETTLRADVRAAGKWQTNQNGIYIAAGVRSQIAGRGGHIALLDDVMSEEDAFSPAGRRYIKEWYPAALFTRLMPNGAVVIINTRYHEDDICGWLLEMEKKQQKEALVNPTVELDNWDVVRIPAWLDEPAAELLGMPVGSSYFPEWKPDDLLLKTEIEIKSQNGSKYWQSLYMQDPVPDEGGLIKKEWFNVYPNTTPPDCEFILQTYDTAFSTRTTADYSVIQTWGIFIKVTADSAGVEHHIPNLILLSSKRDRLEYPELRSTAQEMYDKYTPDAVIVEKKASGQSLIQDLRRAGLPVVEYSPDKDKVSRVNACTPILESGRVWIPDTTFATDLVAEASSFPFAAHDDQVDAMAMAILYMRESWRIESPLDAYIMHEEEIDREASQPKRVGYWRF